MKGFSNYIMESYTFAPTSDNYSSLFVMADYIEEHPEQLKSWFQQLRNVLVGFLKQVEELQNSFNINNVWVDELEEDPLDDMESLINLHMIGAINRVLDDSIVHNGPLFSVAQAIKNNYEDLLLYLKYSEYYSSDDNDEMTIHVLSRINKNTWLLVRKYLTFLKDIFPYFLRMAELRWKSPSNKNNTFERLSSIPKFE